MLRQKQHSREISMCNYALKYSQFVHMFPNVLKLVVNSSPDLTLCKPFTSMLEGSEIITISFLF